MSPSLLLTFLLPLSLIHPPVLENKNKQTKQKVSLFWKFLTWLEKNHQNELLSCFTPPCPGQRPASSNRAEHPALAAVCTDDSLGGGWRVKTDRSQAAEAVIPPPLPGHAPAVWPWEGTHLVISSFVPRGLLQGLLWDWVHIHKARGTEPGRWQPLPKCLGRNPQYKKLQGERQDRCREERNLVTPVGTPLRRWERVS